MPSEQLPGGRYPVGDFELTRVGYGAMQLAGPHVFGPPKDRDEAIRVLRTAVEMGINHIDTSDYYGPYVTNEIIREALSPYPDDLHLVTKVGARRDEQGGWPSARSPEELRQQVHDNLDHLGLEALDVVNLRMGGFEGAEPGSIAEQFTALAELRQQGLIRNLGVSTLAAQRGDDDLVDLTARQGVAFVPYFPLGGFSPLQSSELEGVAKRLGATPLAGAPG